MVFLVFFKRKSWTCVNYQQKSQNINSPTKPEKYPYRELCNFKVKNIKHDHARNANNLEKIVLNLEKRQI